MPAAKPPIMTMKHQTYQIIKKEICDGNFPPGKWLQEKELAEKLNVSRSPVREALKQLVDEGLAIEYPNKGVFVKEFTSRDIEEIYEVRILLESYAIKNSVKTITSKNIQEMKEILQSLIEFYKENDLASYIEIDTKLHEYIINLGGNSLVVDIYRRIYSQTQQFRIYSLTTQRRFDDSAEEHRRIVENIASGDWEEADRINKIHLTLAREEIIEHFEAKKNI
ncbi:putative D-xylose utilization operon transcriptional repressor [Clostridiales bacterium]|nr:putative D-xylose utilization operon transcriptional repressor [Clostridiales bacterium]